MQAHYKYKGLEGVHAIFIGLPDPLQRWHTHNQTIHIVNETLPFAQRL
jgi:hypothetical protein